MVRRRRVIALELAVERVLMHTAESHRTSRRITGTTADVSATGRNPTVAASRTMAASERRRLRGSRPRSHIQRRT